MGSGNGFFAAQDLSIESKWLIDPQQLFVGPEIGEGAHAKIYEGKLLPLKLLEEGKLLKRLQGEKGGAYHGDCDRATLLKYLLNMRPKCLDMRVAIGFALDIARAMECLHSHGMIHRDLKPEYLILTEDHKTVKLADFGLAREESLTEMMTAETGTHKVNYNKTIVFFSANMDNRLTVSICNELGFQHTDNLGNYLGMPLVHSRVTKNTLLLAMDYEKTAPFGVGNRPEFVRLDLRFTTLKVISGTRPIKSGI
ncbi:hypothetical protein F3Y22_tig00110402pilonHSYRG00048 [Hibiscus syriacus]|uniref:Protein kinase domain-containing protein n=1 Tax=Hibiscus syriacus TaxID=106335 RepID=A0A6A3ASB0_HIBSY|nr:hypothetical protein F3Y22_tig00110402pilonHSYRG00048 [Hibiscus syriacus]